MDDEQKIKNMPDPVKITGTETILNQMKNCICKIRINRTNGTGFFCTINCKNKKINVLMTNYHIINEISYIENNELNLFINDDKDVKILNLGIMRKTYFNEKYDLAMIELKEEDNINHFLELDDNLFKNEIKAFYKDISIYVIQYPLGNNAAVSYGLSNGINNFEINHTCSTEYGSSGSPILNLANNKVIGIHKKSAKNFNYNIGTCLQFPLNDFFGKDEIIINIIKKENEKNNETYNNLLNKYEKIKKEFKEIIRIIDNNIPTFYNQIGTKLKYILFSNVKGYKNVLKLNYGTTIDQMLRIYLKIIKREFLYNDNQKVCFIYNAKKIKFGNKTRIECFFRYIDFPKIIVNLIDDYFYPDKEEEQYNIRNFYYSLISEIKGSILDDYYFNRDVTIKFNKGGKIVEIKMSDESMVAELINEYFERTKTKEGTFTFDGIILSPTDASSLYYVGLYDNSEIIVK